MVVSNEFAIKFLSFVQNYTITLQYNRTFKSI